MSEHFLLSAKARSLSLATVMRMSEQEPKTVFRNVRWEDGKAICPHCACSIVYECRRPSAALRFRCKACRKDFSVTSGTLFAHHKMQLRNYLAATVQMGHGAAGQRPKLVELRFVAGDLRTTWLPARTRVTPLPPARRPAEISGPGPALG